MKVSTYKSLLTNNKTMLVVNNDRAYSQGYAELQIVFNSNQWHVYISDGYRIIDYKIQDKSRGLKSLINLYYKG